MVDYSMLFSRLHCGDPRGTAVLSDGATLGFALPFRGRYFEMRHETE